MPCIIYFSGDVKLGRPNKLGANKILILVEFNLTQAFSTVNSSNLILCQIFLLCGVRIVSQVVLYDQQAIACICVQLKNNCTYNSQNCTRLHLVQLLDCQLYNYSTQMVPSTKLAVFPKWIEIVLQSKNHLIFLNLCYILVEKLPYLMSTTSYQLSVKTQVHVILMVFKRSRETKWHIGMKRYATVILDNQTI